MNQKNSKQPVEIIIIGAGMSGLCAAQRLQIAGFRPLIIEKGRGLGGRMATRRLSEAKFDHGAQFVTSRSENFEQQLKKWEGDGIVKVWKGLKDYRIKDTDHWYGTSAMTAIPKAIAQDLNIERSTRVSAISPLGDAWHIRYEDGTEQLANQIICTAPVPQSLSLLDSGQTKLHGQQWEDLKSIQYDPCLAVMALLEKKSSIPTPGAIEFDDGPVSWISDNQQKGISPLPAVTLHSTGAYARSHWDDDRLTCGKELLELMKSHIGSEVLDVQVHGWLYSKVTHGVSELFTRLKGLPPMWLAGDAFGGSYNVEGAALSGWAVAEGLLKNLKQPSPKSS
jgi:renalase